MKLHALAGEPHFLDHIAPIMRALPERLRGPVTVSRGHAGVMPSEQLIAHGISHGLEVTTEPPPPGSAVLVASWGDHKRVRRFAPARIVAMEHGIGQSFSDDHQSYAGGKYREDASLFLAPNKHSADRWQAAYPQARVEVIGAPIIDTLPQREPGAGPVIAISFHWIGGHVPEAQGAFMEYRKALPALAERYTVIGTGHPRDIEKRRAYFERSLRIEVVPDFAEVCRRADLLVCDTNSAPYLFAARRDKAHPKGYPVLLLNRPPTFGRFGIVSDQGFRKHVNHGLRFDPSDGCPIQPGRHFCRASHVGVQCDWPDLLIPSVERALLDTPEQRKAREAALGIVFAHRTGAAKRAAAVLTDWLTGTSEVAA